MAGPLQSKPLRAGRLPHPAVVLLREASLRVLPPPPVRPRAALPLAGLPVASLPPDVRLPAGRSRYAQPPDEQLPAAQPLAGPPPVAAASWRSASSCAFLTRSASLRAASTRAASCRAAACRAASWRSASSRAASIRAASSCAACRCVSCSERSTFASSTARSRASESTRSCAASPASRGAGATVSKLDALGAAAITGVGAGAAGMANAASSGRFMAITSGPGIGLGATSPVSSRSRGAFARVAPVAASGAGLIFAVGLALGMIASAVRSRVGAGDTDSVWAGPPGTGCLIDGRKGFLTDVPAGSAAVTRAGTSTTRRSGASIRRSRQGKPKPGSPSPWPPKVKLNNSACSSRESRSARVSRLRSALMRWLGRWPRPAAREDRAHFGSDGGVRAALEPIEPKRAPPSRIGYCCRRGAGWAPPCATFDLTDPTRHGLANAPRRQS